MDPVVDIAKAYLLERFHEIATMGAEEAEEAITDLAGVLVGDHIKVLAEYAEKKREDIELQRASLAVQKRSAEEQCDAGLATIDKALATLTG